MFNHLSHFQWVKPYLKPIRDYLFIISTENPILLQKNEFMCIFSTFKTTMPIFKKLHKI